MTVAQSKLIDVKGDAHMADTGGKEFHDRKAIANVRVQLNQESVE